MVSLVSNEDHGAIGGHPAEPDTEGSAAREHGTPAAAARGGDAGGDAGWALGAGARSGHSDAGGGAPDGGRADAVSSHGGGMTKNDCQLSADVLREAEHTASFDKMDAVREGFCRRLREDNPRFDRERFLRACTALPQRRGWFPAPAPEGGGAPNRG